ncbi:hypothetical protein CAUPRSCDRAFT_11153 [Caulochytrium protostelioides]|uniref:Uncharacterized protein n=1 Tax=Caulochytrium protostelioides TaxID=1555241 RepID=A0A4P9WWR3_9FUNG|nr:hypothetical protein CAUPRSCDRAFT_11153 [Caulochytrium protostelioides]
MLQIHANPDRQQLLSGVPGATTVKLSGWLRIVNTSSRPKTYTKIILELRGQASTELNPGSVMTTSKIYLGPRPPYYCTQELVATRHSLLEHSDPLVLAPHGRCDFDFDYILPPEIDPTVLVIGNDRLNGVVRYYLQAEGAITDMSVPNIPMSQRRVATEQLRLDIAIHRIPQELKPMVTLRELYNLWSGAPQWADAVRLPLMPIRPTDADSDPSGRPRLTSSSDGSGIQPVSDADALVASPETQVAIAPSTSPRRLAAARNMTPSSQDDDAGRPRRASTLSAGRFGSDATLSPLSADLSSSQTPAAGGRSTSLRRRSSLYQFASNRLRPRRRSAATSLDHNTNTINEILPERVETMESETSSATPTGPGTPSESSSPSGRGFRSIRAASSLLHVPYRVGRTIVESLLSPTMSGAVAGTSTGAPSGPSSNSGSAITPHAHGSRTTSAFVDASATGASSTPSANAGSTEPTRPASREIHDIVYDPMTVNPYHRFDAIGIVSPTAPVAGADASASAASSSTLLGNATGQTAADARELHEADLQIDPIKALLRLDPPTLLEIPTHACGHLRTKDASTSAPADLQDTVLRINEQGGMPISFQVMLDRTVLMTGYPLRLAYSFVARVPAPLGAMGSARSDGISREYEVMARAAAATGLTLPKRLRPKRFVVRLIETRTLEFASPPNSTDPHVGVYNTSETSKVTLFKHIRRADHPNAFNDLVNETILLPSLSEAMSNPSGSYGHVIQHPRPLITISHHLEFSLVLRRGPPLVHTVPVQLLAITHTTVDMLCSLRDSSDAEPLPRFEDAVNAPPVAFPPGASLGLDVPPPPFPSSDSESSLGPSLRPRRPLLSPTLSHPMGSLPPSPFHRPVRGILDQVGRLLPTPASPPPAFEARGAVAIDYFAQADTLANRHLPDRARRSTSTTSLASSMQIPILAPPSPLRPSTTSSERRPLATLLLSAMSSAANAASRPTAGSMGDGGSSVTVPPAAVTRTADTSPARSSSTGTTLSPWSRATAVTAATSSSSSPTPSMSVLCRPPSAQRPMLPPMAPGSSDLCGETRRSTMMGTSGGRGVRRPATAPALPLHLTAAPAG